MTSETGPDIPPIIDTIPESYVDPDMTGLEKDAREFSETSALPEFGTLTELIEFVPEAERQNAERFARWLDIPSEATYLLPILRSLKDRLIQVKNILVLDSVDTPDFLCDLGLLAVIESKNNFALYPHCLRVSDRSYDPSYGVQKHPLYAMLPFKARGKEKLRAYEQLQAQVIAGAVCAWDEEDDKYFYGTHDLLKQAAFATRKLTHNPVIVVLPMTVLSRQDYLLALRVLIQSPPQTVKWNADIERWIGQVVAFLEKLESIESGDDYVELATPQTYIAPVENGTPIGWWIRYTTTNIHLSDKRRSRTSGLAQAEFTDDLERVVFERDETRPKPDKPPPVPPTTMELVRNRQYQIAVMERASQHLPQGWNRLRPNEVAACLHAFAEVIEDDSDGRRKWTNDTLRLKTAALLMTMFWTSHSLNDSLELVLVSSLESLTTGSLPKCLAYIINENLWYIPAIRPKGAPKHYGCDLSKAEPVVPFQILPVPDEVARFIKRLPANENTNKDGHTVIFADDAPVLWDMATDVMGQLIMDHPQRITSSRIEQHVFWTMHDYVGDMADASLCVGRPHVQADTALHYDCEDRSNMALNYVAICDSIITDARADIAYRGVPLMPFNKVGAQHPIAGNAAFDKAIGVPVCPLPSSIQRLQTEIGYALDREHPGVSEFLLRHHNLLTLYTVLMLKMATGYRDIKSPLPRRSDINLLDNTILISDKDDVASFSSRVLPLVGVMRQQLLEYDLHIRVLASRLTLVAPELARQLFRQFGLAPNAPVDPGSESKRRAGNKQSVRRPSAKELEAPPIFFLDDDAKGKLDFEVVSPRTLGRKLDKYARWFKLPTNSNRAYLRRHLKIKEGNRYKTTPADPAAVNYLMGHWYRGREPLGLYAGLPIQFYLDSLVPRLEEILRLDGWATCKGIS